jgi:hypothetical protein
MSINITIAEVEASGGTAVATGGMSPTLTTLWGNERWGDCV